MKIFEVVLSQDEGFYGCLRKERPPIKVNIQCSSSMEARHRALVLLYKHKRYIHATVFNSNGDSIVSIQK